MDGIQQQWDSLLFDVRRSVRYHERRRNFYETWNLTTSALSLLFGSAAIYLVLKDHETLTVIAAAVVAVASTVDLVVNTSRMAHLHSDLCRRFIELEKTMVLHANRTTDDYNRIWAARLDIEKDEPPIKRIVDIICHNELVFAGGYDESCYQPIPLYKRLSAHCFNWNYRPVSAPQGSREQRDDKETNQKQH